jgi:hypothetical protein
MGLIQAHVDLLRAELAVAGRKLGVIVGLAAAAVALALLTGLLLYIGSWLFFGEWLFGSMAWGILHGTFLAVAIITGIGINLAGGWTGSYVRGFIVGLVTFIVLSLLFASNLLRQGAVSSGDALEPTVPLVPELLPTLVGAVVGAIVLAIVAFAAARRTEWRTQAIVAGLVLGGLLGAILGSAVFDNPGAVAIGLTVGLLVWPSVAVWLADRRGFDPESRYADLAPRRSMAAFEETREFLSEQFSRQKRRILGR